MKRILVPIMFVLLVVFSLSACIAEKDEHTGVSSITIREWLDSEGGSDADTMTVKVVSIENPVWAVVNDSSDNPVHLFGVMVDGEFRTFEEAGISEGDTIVISAGTYHVFDGTVEIKEADLIEIIDRAR